MDLKSKESLKEALDSCIGAPTGFLDATYRQWCVDHPDEVIRIHSGASSGEGATMSNREMLETFHREELLVLFDGHLDESGSKAGADLAKDNAASKSLREKGNVAYQRKQNHEALALYLGALKEAEDGSEDKALAFANRSAALLSLGTVEDIMAALRDIDRALKANYPEAIKYKLLERRGKCLAKLKQFGKAEEAFKEAIALFSKAEGVPDEKRTLIDVDLVKQLKGAKEKSSNEDPDLDETRTKAVPKVGCHNPKFPALKASVGIAFSKEQGRYAVALRDITAGELLAVEAAEVCTLNLEQRGENCTNCLARVPDYLPSPVTKTDVFCSERCLEEAMGSYHEFEASLQPFIYQCIKSKTDWLLGLKAILQRPAQFFLNGTELFGKHDVRFGTGDGMTEPYEGNSGSSYKCLFNLVTQDDKCDVTKRHFRALVATFFTRCLRRLGYFRCTSDQRADHIEIARLMMHFMAVASMNCHEVAEYRVNGASEPWLNGRPVGIGSSLEVTLDLFNHSCDPNTLRFHWGNTIVVYSGQNIKEGEEITDCYGSQYFEACRPERQAYLAKYMFTCKCRACQEDWPLAAELPKMLVDTPDDQLMFNSDNQAVVKAVFGKLNKYGTKIAMEQKTGNYKEILPLCLEFFQVLAQTIRPPHNFYIMTKRFISKSLWITQGSKFRTSLSGES